VTNDRDHAVRAVQMAVEQPFEIRIGINTGQASIGNFGSKGEWRA